MDPKRGWVVVVSMTLMIIALVSGRLGNPLTALILLVLWNSLTIILYYAWLPLKRDPFADPAVAEEHHARIAAEKAAGERMRSQPNHMPSEKNN